MTCLEAQSNIMAFIDKKLPDDKAVDFVRHMRYCPNCFEELEIYYTLTVGIRQVDNNEELSQNFKEDLENELNRLEHKVKKAKRFKVSGFGVIFIAAVFLMFICYGRVLNKVYNVEQIMLKEKQGPHYFYDYFGETIELCQEDMIALARQQQEPEELTFYEKIRGYNRTHNIGIDENGEDTIGDISDE
ncbi:MAG: anti-sigma factor family protein [Wujia sp.]